MSSPFFCSGRRDSEGLLKQRGFTFVELIMATVIIGIVSVALLQTLGYVTVKSVDPMFRTQSIAIAESYLEEISNKSFLDPTSGSVCPAAPGTRDLYDNICDYKGIAADTQVKDQFGNVIAGLESYAVATVIDESAGVDLNGITGPDAILIQVTVTDPRGQTLTLSTYRSRYP